MIQQPLGARACVQRIHIDRICSGASERASDRPRSLFRDSIGEGSIVSPKPWPRGPDGLAERISGTHGAPYADGDSEIAA